MSTIAIDYSWLGPTGIGRVADEVMRRMPSGWHVKGIREGRANAAPLTPVDLWMALSRTKAEVFWSPGFMPPLHNSGIPTILTIHDLTHLHFYSKTKRNYYKFLIKPLLKHAAHIVTVSNFTRNELLAWSGLPPDKVTMIPNAVSPQFAQDGRSIDISKPFILYPGNRRSYKNVQRLMAAFASSGLAGKGYVLGLTGCRTAEFDQLERALDLESHVHYFGFVSDEDLPALFRGAHALAFVSLYEGFGLPILEAMASGIPVLTSNVSSMPEVAGQAALLVDPTDVHEIAEGLMQICENQPERKALVQKGLAHARQYSWDKTANEYWKLFSDVKRD